MTVDLKTTCPVMFFCRERKAEMDAVEAVIRKHGVPYRRGMHKRLHRIGLHKHRVILSPWHDGVWLKCECGWWHRLGWLCTPFDAGRITRIHRCEGLARDRKHAARARTARMKHT